MYHKDDPDWNPGPDGWDGNYPGETMTVETRYVVKAYHFDPAARAQDVYQISGPWPNRQEAEAAMARLKPEWDDCDLAVEAVQVDLSAAED